MQSCYRKPCLGTSSYRHSISRTSFGVWNNNVDVLYPKSLLFTPLRWRVYIFYSFQGVWCKHLYNKIQDLKQYETDIIIFIAYWLNTALFFFFFFLWVLYVAKAVMTFLVLLSCSILLLLLRINIINAYHGSILHLFLCGFPLFTASRNA